MNLRWNHTYKLLYSILSGGTPLRQIELCVMSVPNLMDIGPVLWAEVWNRGIVFLFRCNADM